MRQSYKIERRLPFGFCGDWGRLYKRYTPIPQEAALDDNGQEIIVDFDGTPITVNDNDAVIKYQKNFYVDIGQDVQLRESTDETGGLEAPNAGMVADIGRMTVKTTDAYFDNIRKRYECIIKSGDIVRAFGRQWIVGDVNARVAKRTPHPMKIFFCELTSTL